MTLMLTLFWALLGYEVLKGVVFQEDIGTCERIGITLVVILLAPFVLTIEFAVNLWRSAWGMPFVSYGGELGTEEDEES